MTSYGVPNVYILGSCIDAPGSRTIDPVPEDVTRNCAFLRVMNDSASVIMKFNMWSLLTIGRCEPPSNDSERWKAISIKPNTGTGKYLTLLLAHTTQNMGRSFPDSLLDTTSCFTSTSAGAFG